jgi:uncharacterized OB-fold protein
VFSGIAQEKTIAIAIAIPIPMLNKDNFHMNPLPPAYKCTNCGRVATYHRLRCLNCRNERFEETELPTEAKLVTFTETHQLPVGFDQRFLRMGIAEFSNGARATGWITFEGAKTGTAVEVRWEPIREKLGEPVYGFTFHTSS